MKAGTAVDWIQRDRSGNPVRTVRSFVAREPFNVVRNCDQLPVPVVILSCQRLVPLADVVAAGTAPKITRPEPQPVAKTETEQRSEYRAAAIARAEQLAKSRGASLPAPAARAAEPARPEPAQPARPAEPARAAEPAAAGCEVLAIDFLNLLVRAYHSGTKTEVHAVRSMFQTVAGTVRTLRPRRIVFALDGGHVHRTALLPEYKAHRPPDEPGLVAQKELAEKAIRAAGLQAVRVEGFEADDVLASIARRYTGTVICSSDKDLLALCSVARVFHPWQGGQFVTSESRLGLPAGQVTDFLALCGDTSDGVPGVKGVGEKTAAALLAEFESLEGVLVAAKLGRIKGTIGRKIAEQTAAAELCRRVVELRENLPLPELVEWRPPGGFENRLQELRLGSVAAILSSLHSSGERSTPKAAAAELIGEPAEPPVSIVRRSISEPVRNGLSVSELWDGPDGGLICCWESGRAAAARGGENPWRAGTLNAAAWLQGFELRDLEIDTSGRSERIASLF
ncbi:MAG: hypothetical protein JNM43_07610 [Planctomycetaceae bacterium]|nr:hypothetical protein [Planctomycetaceae bacterium]